MERREQFISLVSVFSDNEEAKVKFAEQIFEGRSFDGSVIDENTPVTAVKTTPFEIEVKKEDIA